MKMTFFSMMGIKLRASLVVNKYAPSSYISQHLLFPLTVCMGSRSDRVAERAFWPGTCVLTSRVSDHSTQPSASPAGAPGSHPGPVAFLRFPVTPPGTELQAPSPTGSACSLPLESVPQALEPLELALGCHLLLVVSWGCCQLPSRGALRRSVVT